MTTGTIKDPYEDVKRPVCGEFVEIGQPTFAELIWAREVLTRATSGSAPNVREALRIIAYGESPVELPLMRKQGAFTAIAPATSPAAQTAAAPKYSIGKNGGEAYKQKVQGLGMAKASVDFNTMIVNDSDVGIEAALITPQSDSGCASISSPSGAAPPINPLGCPDSDCNVDAIFSIDLSGSMRGAIDNVKIGAAGMAALIDTVSGGSYRFGLSSFGQVFARGTLQLILPLSNVQCGNIAEFQSHIDPFIANGNTEPWDQVLTVSATNNSPFQTFRSNSDARIIFIITDESGDAFIQKDAAISAAQELGRCGIRVVIIWTDSPFSPPSDRTIRELFDPIVDATGGIWVHAPEGANIAALMSSFILSVCGGGVVDDPNAPCPAASDKLLNGKFEASIAQWDDLTILGGRVVEHDPVTQTMKVSGRVGQTIRDLEPGNIATLSFDVHTDDTPTGPTVSTHSKRSVVQQGTGNPNEKAWSVLPGDVFSINLHPSVVQAPDEDGLNFSNELVYLFDFSGLPDGETVVNIKFDMLYDHGSHLHGSSAETMLDTAFLTLNGGATKFGNDGAHPGHLVRFRTGGDLPVEDHPIVNAKKWYGDTSSGETPGAVGDPTFTTPLTTTQLKTTDVGLVIQYQNAGVGSVSGPNSIQPGQETGSLQTVRNITAVVTYGSGSEGRLDYQLRKDIGPILISDSLTTTDIQPVGQSNRQTRELTAIVPDDGVIEVFFDGEGGTDQPFFVDNCSLCVISEDDCGAGTTNLIQNPNFETGVGSWNDASDTAISPTTDPDVWDSVLNAIIVSLTGEPEVRQTITALIPGRNYSLNFEIASLEPSVIPELEVVYGALDSSNAVIQSDSFVRGDINPPERFQLNFFAPSDGIAKIFFKGGVTSGVAKIRNVLLCDTSGECQSGFTKISFDDFETSRGAWAGGTRDAVQELIILGPIGGDNTLSQTFTALIPGTLVQLSFNQLDSGIQRVEFHSGPVINQFNTNGVPGIKVFSSVVQDDGIITILISNQHSADVRIDDVLVCQQDSILACDGSITDLEVLVEWDGIPRKPTNLFNMIVRYTIRDPLDPFSITTVTHITDDEGVLGLPSCDTWKQQGQGGVPQAGILAFGLTPSIANSIAPGDFSSVASRTNYIWSIPDTGGIQDMLSVGFQQPPPGLIESVEVLMLSNHVLPSGADSTPVAPPPLLCSPDPASELKVSIRFKNSQNLQREFTQIINKNNIWQQNADFTSDLWDTNLPVGHGFKGTTARWESFPFVLDDVDGRGIDQCTTPLFFRAVGQGVLNLPEFKFDRSQAQFVDECLAEILITPLSAGSSVDEIQSVVLPAPSGGTWTLAFDFGTIETTTAIPWNAVANQVRNRLAALANIGSNDNVTVTGTGTQADPFLITLTGTLGARDHNLLVGDGNGLTGASSAFVTTVNDGTINERQTITRNSDTVFADLLATFGGVTTTPLAFNRSLNEAQSAFEGLSSIGVGNVLITGDVTDRDAAYFGPLRIDFVGTLGGQNVGLITVEPSASYTVTLNWMGGIAPAGGVDENQLITVEANGGSFVLRVFDIGGSSPAINVDTPTQGGTTETDCYDVTFGGTLSAANIDPNTFFGPLVGPTAAFSHTQQNIRQGGTEPEIQRHCFQWLLGGGGIGSDNSPFGLTNPSDSIFTDILNTVGATNLVKGVDTSAAIKAYLESAAAVTSGDLTIVSQQLAGTIDEVQTVTITGSPASGFFALIVEGERTADLPFNATAAQVQNALNALPNLSEVVVTVSGALPSDVVFTITFSGADGGRNWQTIIADASNLNGGSLFSDTGDIAFNSTAAALKTALVSAAAWLTTDNIDVIKVADLPVGKHQWNVFWSGGFSRLNIPQMQANPSGSQLTGAPINITEVAAGAGSNERQRLQIIRATGGSFKLSITLDGRTEQTTAIPWNTSAAGLEAQLLQLTFFDTPGQVSVVDDFPTMLPPDPINSQFTVVFQKIFGDVPLMVAEFQATLLCNPIILPHVDPGPYDYPLPDCEDLSDLSCQSGPLLCKPGEGDDPFPDPDCCDNETITQAANKSLRLQIERDLFDPNRMINGERMTLRDITLIKGLRPDEYTPYERNFRSGVLTETSYDRKVETKLSFVLVENNLDTRNGRNRVLGHLSEHREILPTRFTWPDESF